MSTTSEARPVKVRTAEELHSTIVKRTYSEGRGCLIWKGAVDRDGYPKIAIDSTGKIRQVHRIHWTLEIGPIPDGTRLARLSICSNRRCIAPAHLALEQGALTAARASSPTSKCTHKRTQDNTLQDGGCQTCRMAYLDRHKVSRPGKPRLTGTPMPFFGALRQRTR